MTATDVEQALLAAIRDAPYDNQPRLVYADWLQQHGDPRGEYIAAACLPEGAGYERAIELWKEHGERWSAALPAWIKRAPTPDFERGFPSRVWIESLVMVDLAELVALAPIPTLVIRDATIVVRADARVCARCSHEQSHGGPGSGSYGGIQHLAILELPSQRVLAEAENPYEGSSGYWSSRDYMHGFAQRLQFAGNVLRYDLVDAGDNEAETRLSRELAFEIPSSVP